MDNIRAIVTESFIHDLLYDQLMLQRNQLKAVACYFCGLKFDLWVDKPGKRDSEFVRETEMFDLFLKQFGNLNYIGLIDYLRSFLVVLCPNID